jgi:hypothetical protein
MSEPKRYEIGVDFVAPVFVPVETKVGDWVKWEDYARLRAEVERLTAEVSYDKRCELHTDKLAAEFTQAQVERLTKAGDAMASMLQFEETLNDSDRIPQSVQNWNAAKEGKGQP